MIYRKTSLIKKIEKLKEYAHDLREFENIEFDVYIRDRKTKYSIERILFLICENILDFLDHILSSRFDIVSDSYEEIIYNTYKVGIINKTLYEKLKGLGGFRNILAHEYMNISDEETYKNFKKMLNIINEVINSFEELVK